MYVEANELSQKVQIVSSRDELNPEDKVDLIFGEPNFVTSILPWDNVHFWHLSSKYPESISRIPKALTVKAVAVEFKDLHKIRAPLGVCEGFDLSTFDKLVQVDRRGIYQCYLQLINFIITGFKRHQRQPDRGSSALGISWKSAELYFHHIEIRFREEYRRTIQR